MPLKYNNEEEFEMNYIRINFDMLSELLDNLKKAHQDFEEIKNKAEVIIDDFKNLIIILIGEQ